jgi:hypothetical protein
VPGSAELKPFAISQTPLGRMSRPVDIAKVTAFLVSLAMPRGLRISSFPYLGFRLSKKTDHGVTFAEAGANS